MQNSPFVLKDEVTKLPVKLTSLDDAQLVVGRKKSMFTPDVIFPDKKYLLWTHEPFFDRFDTPRVWNFFPETCSDRSLNVFNVHNGQVYTDNFYLAPNNGKLRNVNEPDDLNVSFANKTITFAATFKLAQCVISGADRSLNAARCDLATELHKMGRVKIIGRDWPDDMAEDESRFDDRARSKAAFLKGSNFNLCYENCNADYYVTEKLWESIFGGCLPIYYSNNTIYQNFPTNSFIDGRDFDNADSLIAFVDDMPFEEFRRRINLCRRVFNFSTSEKMRAKSRARALDKLRAFLNSMPA